MLKKQTVWLLTMLSLVVVLSVYYIFGEDQKSNVANVDNEQAGTEEMQNEADGATSNQLTTDQAFEAIRLQMQDDRGRRIEELQTIVGSTELSAEEISEAKDEMEMINEIAEKERLLEKLIVSTLNYEDALVRADGKNVSITVKGQEPSKTNANAIIQMAAKEMGTSSVQVSFQTEDETK
ncbi:SpoIIIAH-like family protein [Caldibacillus lycopersici]|uniref:SpoIIIAH-like family protein n=2 Tax=Perspicuibacillus lycopersici TaxID=1325689 RepID=A0AAE3IUW2_9BACI|nr:SpoIIIAH-like family protein [Perspicuibacillus lycopersici]